MLGDRRGASLDDKVVFDLDLLQELHVGFDVLEQGLELVDYGLRLDVGLLVHQFVARI